MLDMMKMMGKVKEVQEKMKIAKEELDNLFVESDSGAGLVTA
jgi:DNA-binding protein YbaB